MFSLEVDISPGQDEDPKQKTDLEWDPLNDQTPLTSVSNTYSSLYLIQILLKSNRISNAF